MMNTVKISDLPEITSVSSTTNILVSDRSTGISSRITKANLVSDVVSNLNSEASFRAAADNELQTSIGNEAVARENFDNILLSEISLISESLSAESQARSAADSSLQSYINNKANTDNPQFTGVIRLNGNVVDLNNLDGTNYAFVYATGIPTQNAIEFTNAYNSIDSGTLIFAPGIYEFPTTFVHNKDNVNIVSLTGNRDGIFTVPTSSIALILSANNSLVKGIETNLMISVTQGLTGLVMEKIKGGDNSFNKSSLSAANTRLTYTAIDVEGGDYSFGNGDGANGFPDYVDALYNCTLIRCKGGEGAYAFNNTMFGCKLYDTEGLDYSYGCTDGERSSGIVNCNFYRTIGGPDSYGANADLDKRSGNYYYCLGGRGSAIANTTGVKLFCAVNNVAV